MPAAERFDAPGEIARRSSLSKQEVMRYLQDCQANQQDMYFCVLRDLVVAENKFSQQASLVSKQSKICADRTSAQSTVWLKKRKAVCKQAAAQAAGGGSDEPRQRLACQASMTDDYAKHFDTPAGCGP